MDGKQELDDREQVLGDMEQGDKEQDWGDKEQVLEHTLGLDGMELAQVGDMVQVLGGKELVSCDMVHSVPLLHI